MVIVEQGRIVVRKDVAGANRWGLIDCGGQATINQTTESYTQWVVAESDH